MKSYPFVTLLYLPHLTPSTAPTAGYPQCVVEDEVYTIGDFIGVGARTPVRAIALSRTLREVPPADYLFQIQSFSLLSNTLEKRYESGDFVSGGYAWKLCLYPNGEDKNNGKGHISLYLAISRTDTLPPGWEVNVNFKLFVYDQVRDKYLTIQDADGSISRFHRLKTECGFAKLLSLDTFNDASNGYLVDDSCAFGAEVCVIKPTGRGECLSMMKVPSNNTYTWEITSFSILNAKSLYSQVFSIGNHQWKILIYPKGSSNGEGNSLSDFLQLADCGSVPTKRKLYVESKLRVKDQLRGKHHEMKVHNWFCTKSYIWGFNKVVSLADLHDKSKGFIVGDTLVIEGQIDAISVVKEFS